jgi:hypothetical protein
MARDWWAPVIVRRHPETFCCSLTIRVPIPRRLLSNETCGSVMNRR